MANTRKPVDGLELPNLEDPAALLNPRQLCLGEYSRWEKQPFPAGLGWFPKTWYPRALLAGIMPADRPVEQELRAAYGKLLPPDQRAQYLKHGLPDMNFKFFNGASPGLALPFLKGGEQVVTENLSPEGALRFQLPADTPHVGLDIGQGVQEPPVVLHTVMIRMEDRQVDMLWRGAVPYPGPDWFPQMQKMDLTVR